MDFITEILGINRNIVECKVEKICKSAECVIVLIETLWNVKNQTSGTVPT